MNQKLRNTFFKAAERLFNLPSGHYSCHSINRIVGVSISDSSHERTLYENLFNCEWLTFGSHLEKYFPEEASSMTPFEIDDELKEVRVLALLLAGHILSDDRHTKRLDDEERQLKTDVFQHAAELLFEGYTEFSCIALKKAVWEREGVFGYNHPVERDFHESVFDCKHKTFEGLLKEYFPAESELAGKNYLLEARMLAVLLSGEIYADQQ